MPNKSHSSPDIVQKKKMHFCSHLKYRTVRGSKNKLIQTITNICAISKDNIIICCHCMHTTAIFQANQLSLHNKLILLLKLNQVVYIWNALPIIPPTASKHWRINGCKFFYSWQNVLIYASLQTAFHLPNMKAWPMMARSYYKTFNLMHDSGYYQYIWQHHILIKADETN